MKKKIAIVFSITALSLGAFAPAAFANDYGHHRLGHRHSDSRDVGGVLNDLLDVVGNLL